MTHSEDSQPFLQPFLSWHNRPMNQVVMVAEMGFMCVLNNTALNSPRLRQLHALLSAALKTAEVNTEPEVWLCPPG